jgi:multicomponent Na+:H+ antiporter subunit B
MAMPDSFTLLNAGVLLLMAVAAVGVVRTRNLLAAVMLMSVYSLLMAVAYLVLGAPDVAITEAAIGAGIGTVLFLAALLLTGEEEKPAKHRLAALFTVCVTGALILYATLDLPSFGDPNAVTNAHVTAYYLHHALPETGVPNVVTAVLASYRGYDTLGETFVIFTAGISVMLLLGRKKKKT